MTHPHEISPRLIPLAKETLGWFALSAACGVGALIESRLGREPSFLSRAAKVTGLMAATRFGHAVVDSANGGHTPHIGQLMILDPIHEYRAARRELAADQQAIAEATTSGQWVASEAVW